MASLIELALVGGAVVIAVMYLWPIADRAGEWTYDRWHAVAVRRPWLAIGLLALGTAAFAVLYGMLLAWAT